jgi:hypothetical protein
VALVSLLAFFLAVRFDGLLYFLMFGVVANLTGWPALRGIHWQLFQRAFPEAQWVGESQPPPVSGQGNPSLTTSLSQSWWFCTPTGLTISGLAILLMSLEIWAEIRTGRFEGGFGRFIAIALVASLLWFYVRMVLHYIRHLR